MLIAASSEPSPFSGSLSYLPLCRQVNFRHHCRHVLRPCSCLRCRCGSVSNVAGRRKELNIWNPVDIKKFKTFFYLPRSSDERFAITQTSSPAFYSVPTATCTPTRTVSRSMTSILTRSLISTLSRSLTPTLTLTSSPSFSVPDGGGRLH